VRSRCPAPRSCGAGHSPQASGPTAVHIDSDSRTPQTTLPNVEPRARAGPGFGRAEGDLTAHRSAIAGMPAGSLLEDDGQRPQRGDAPAAQGPQRGLTPRHEPTMAAVPGYGGHRHVRPRVVPQRRRGRCRVWVIHRRRRGGPSGIPGARGCGS
jgi:hypothetical protein